MDMERRLLNTLNTYAEEYKRTGNKNIVPAIGRITNKLEEMSGKKVKAVNSNGKAKYILE